MVLLLLGSLALSDLALARTPRPQAVVYVTRRGRNRDILYRPIRYGRVFWLTRTPRAPTALQCTADGRYVTWAEDGRAWARRLTPSGKPLMLRALPKTIWQLHQNQLRSFIQLSATGRYVALPDPKGVFIYDLREQKSLLIRPPTPGGSGPQKVRVIHPARWLPDHDAFLYLTQTGERGSGEVNARIFDLVQGRHTIWFPVLTRPVDGVEGFDATWNAGGTRVALSLGIRHKEHRRTRIRIVSVNPYKVLHLPRRLTLGRIHGFDPYLGDIVFTARLGRSPAKLWSYSFTRKRRKLLDIGYLGAGRLALGFFPERRTALLAQPYASGPCAGRAKLYKASVRYRSRSLVGWARWTEIVASDPRGAWLIFRSGSTCVHRRPVLYLMQADGWGLMRDMPRRFRALRTVSPEKAALCPAPPRRRRGRRR